MKDIKKCIDLTGRTFGMLKVLEIVPTETRKTYWLCQCECGNIIKARSDSLQNGNIVSCKCKRNAQFKGNTYQRKHNMCDTRLYSEWQGMKQRCYDENIDCYERYGGRGITVCSEWLDMENGSTNFIKWAIDNGYSDNLTLDRINNDGSYDPANCRWATNKEQSNNRRSNIVVEHDGNEYTLTQLCEMLDLPFGAIHARYNTGERGERLIRPIGSDPNLNGKNAKMSEETARAIKNELNQTVNCIELAQKYGVSKHVVYDIKRGKTWGWLK